MSFYFLGWSSTSFFSFIYILIIASWNFLASLFYGYFFFILIKLIIMFKILQVYSISRVIHFFQPKALLISWLEQHLLYINACIHGSIQYFHHLYYYINYIDKFITFLIRWIIIFYIFFFDIWHIFISRHIFISLYFYFK